MIKAKKFAPPSFSPSIILAWMNLSAKKSVFGMLASAAIQEILR